MEICKNIRSGKSFVYLRSDTPDKFLSITPDGEIKPLETRFFEESIEVDDDSALDQGLITKEQLERYEIYRKLRKSDFSDHISVIAEEASPIELIRLVERLQEYVDNLEKRIQ